MTPDRKRLTDLYHQALARSAQDRDAFLDHPCSGTPVRAIQDWEAVLPK